MSSILELPEARALAARWSVDDYEQYGEMLAEQGVLPKRSELIRGIIIEKMPKSPLHRALTKRLYDSFLRLLSEGYTLFQEGPIRLADSEPEPDLMVVRGEERDFAATHPTKALLVVEVAVSSVAMDREYALMYAEAGVDEYWIVLAEAQKIEVRRRLVAGVYQETLTYGRGETLACSSLPQLAVSLDELFS